MARYPHLQLIRLPDQRTRRKTGRLGPTPRRDSGHGAEVRLDVDRAITEQREQRRQAPPSVVDPSLLLRVKMNGAAMETDWDQLGLTLISSDEDNSIILFSSSDELNDFRQRIEAYEGPKPDGQMGRRYESFINRVGDIGTVDPQDRLGMRLREAGFSAVEDFQDAVVYTLDVELWDFGPQALRRRKAEDISEYIENADGEVFDTYVGPSITMMRIRASGSAIRPLLYIPEVAFIDHPPAPDISADENVEMTLANVPPVNAVDPDAPIIGILDSGINAHPLLQDVLIASEAFPPELGTADVWGHGTRVGGATVFGDLRNQIGQGALTKSVRLVSAKVITDQGQFHERRTLPTQMRAAITQLHENYGCRIFVLSLGDVRARNERGRVGPWAATLDEIARELNVLLLVSAGNRTPRSGTSLEQAITEYPSYLTEEANRICEPGGAVNVVTVGSLAHSTGIGPEHAENVHIQAITNPLEPSPFTRAGAGAGGIPKPDFVDMGGTYLVDAWSRTLRKAPRDAGAGVITLNHQFLNQLFTSATGTSYAAPLLARKAGELLRIVPAASANLLRALLVGAATIPDASKLKLAQIGADAAKEICGNGLVDPVRAAYSDEHRVVFFAEDALNIDEFALYRIPIPDAFQNGGKRTVRVSLAFDPPVRRTRAEYIGVKMNYRLIRGCPSAQIFGHYRERPSNEDVPEIPKRFNCDLKPGPQKRDPLTLQTSKVSFTKDTDGYGDEYYLVVRCQGGWAAEQETQQRYAVVVELEHQQGIPLYARVRTRVNA